MTQKQEKVKEPKTIVQRLLDFHGEMPKIYKESDNPYFKSKYSTYETIMKACQPLLNKHGLVVSHYTFIENEKEYIKTVVCSLENEKIESTSPVIPSRTDIQSKGAYFTYMKRYHVIMLLGIPIYDENDDDGEALMNGIISENQYKQLEVLLKGHPELKDRVLRGYEITGLKLLPRAKFEQCKKGIVKELNGEK